MAYIDPEGMFGGNRMALLSDSARMAWPWFWCASNTVGRVELNYQTFLDTAFRQFKKPPAEQQFWDWVSEYHESYLMFVYHEDGKVWGQWWTSAKYLPKYKTRADERTPPPMAGPYLTWQREYEKIKLSAIHGKCRVLNVSANFQNISEDEKNFQGPEKFPLGEERRGEEKNQPLTPFAPTGAEKKKRGKRSTEEIRKALGEERLTWWENFWKVYPCKDGMNPAMDAFERKAKTREIAVEMYNGAKRYAAKCAAFPEREIKFAQGWINDERWTDQGSIVQQNGTTPWVKC